MIWLYIGLIIYVLIGSGIAKILEYSCTNYYEDFEASIGEVEASAIKNSFKTTTSAVIFYMIMSVFWGMMLIIPIFQFLFKKK